jgi:1-deoxy-D-xylulose-5-phosphate reductoisomerase
MKNIAILGSTGSIGTSALEVISKFPDRFNVSALTAGKNISLLLEQIRKFNPAVVAVSDEEAYKKLKGHINGKLPEALCGVEGVSAAAALSEADIVISAIVGSAGLLPTLAAVKAGKTIGLANKEALVVAGNIIMPEAKKKGVKIIPVDSEHSAIFQCIGECGTNAVNRLILTASGGPFAGKNSEYLASVTLEDALKHPNWSMGRKITIDSATLMNKGLEVIEAHYLFDMPADKIDTLIHPQSIIHSIVEFNDRSYLAQLSKPDMKGPIAYALSYPERLYDVMEPLNWETISALTFMKPDKETFRCLSLAYEALKTGGTMPAVLNAANEAAVQAFLNKRTEFNSIPVIIEEVMNFHSVKEAVDIETLLDADAWAREKTSEVINQ